jgi:type I restriction enzyme S subunit
MAGRYKAYPEYKDTDIEQYPNLPESGWGLYAVRYLVDSSKYYQIGDGDHGAIKPTVYSEAGIPYFRVQNLSWKGDVSYEGMVYIPEEVHRNNLKSKLLPGDILIAKTGATIGKLCLLPPEISEANTTSSVGKVSVDGSRFSNKYVLYCFISKSFTDQIWIDAAQKSAQPGFNIEDFITYKIAAPSLPEQKQIAHFLDHETGKIDSLIEKQQALIELLKEKRQAVISHAVTKGLNPEARMKDSGVEWLGDVPEHWEVASLKFYAQVIDCKHITAEFLDTGYPLASIGEVKGWHINLEGAKFTSYKFYSALIEGNREPRGGDIIYSRNATVGEAALVPEEHPEFAMGQDVCLIRLGDALYPEFALHVLKSGLISQQLDVSMIGSTFKRINVDDIRSFTFTLPPLAEQRDLVAELNEITVRYDSLIDNALEASDLLRERRTALISAAVTGKIDVRDWEPAPKAQKQAN